MSCKVTRRQFLQTASLAAASFPLTKIVSAETGFARTASPPPGSFEGTRTVTGGVCEMCFWRCQLVGKIRDNRLIKLEGNPKSIDNGKSICARGNAGIKLLYDPDRLKYPLKNVGERGNPQWKRISWEEALNECGARLKAVQEKYGGHGIAVFPHGSSAKYPMDFFERVVGTPNISEASFFQCRGIRDSGYMATFATAPDENVDMANAKAIFLLGCHFGENVHVSHVKRYLKGLEKGAKLIVVDPRYSASAAKSDIWVRIKPGTDTAFLLAVMNYLVERDKFDKKFVAAHCVGFQQFKSGISHASLDWAAKICDIPVQQIREVAELLASNAPHVAIHPGRHVSWHGNDFQRLRAQACLTALLGAVGVQGGFVKPKALKVKGISWAKGGEGVEHNLRLLADKYPYSPPGTPSELIRDACLTGKPYPIKACVIWGQNPMQSIPNQQRTMDALKQMEFVLCVDIMPTDITMYADILLPEASYLERFDFIKTGTQWNLADKHQQYVAPRMPLVDAMFECRDGVWITNEIAKRMGHGDKIPVNSLEEKVNRELGAVNLSIDQLRKEEGIHIRDGQDPYGVADDFEVQLYNEDIADNGYPGVPTYIPVEEVPKGFTRLVYGRSPVHTFNRTQNNVWLHHAMPVNPVWLNDEVAEKMGLRDGDEVSLVNSEDIKSTTKTVVKVTPGIRKDIVYMYHGYGSRNSLLSVGAHAGIDDQELITKLAIDPETGCHGMRNNFVKFVKDGKVLDIPA
ncbi:MAG: molybdopterin-dependent oxidoreductase [Deltaproteobacteria bacterium]|nr:molybdopterin-dependent oxidoreductase [Deltaproteobacteria bacterium]